MGTGGSGGATTTTTTTGSSATTAASSGSTSSTSSTSSSGSPPSCAGQPGCVEAFVGSYRVPGTADGTGTAARFTNITGITGDGDDTLWVTDATSVRQISISTGNVTTFAGTHGKLTGIAYVGSEAGSAPFLLVTDQTNFVVLDINPATPATSTVFSGVSGMSGTMNGTPTTYQAPGPLAWVAGSGRYFILDGNAVRFFFNSGAAATLAVGTPPMPSMFDRPGGLLAEATPGTLGANYTAVVSDTGNAQLLLFSTPSTLQMPWMPGLVCGGSQGFQDGTCGTAQFSGPQGLAWRDTLTVLVADTGNHRVREVSLALTGTGTTAVVTTLAGDGTAGHLVGVQPARIDGPTELFFSATGKALFIVDAGGTEILRASL